MLQVNQCGINILEQLREAGTLLESPCNGKGLCGKCRIRVLSGDAGPVTQAEEQFLTPEELSEGIRLACMAVPNTPVELDPLGLLDGGEGKVLGDGEMPDFPMAPAVTARALEPDGGARAEGRALLDCLPGGFRPGPGGPGLPLLRSLPLAAQAGPLEGISYLGGLAVLRRPGHLWGLAVDIGTTTVAVALVDLRTGACLGEDGFVNPQKAYGLDVLSRIHYTLEHPGGERDLQAAIVQDLQESARTLCRQAGGETDDIFEAAVAGNSTMIHALLGVDPASLARAPFNNVFNGPVTLPAGDLGLQFHPTAMVYCLSAVSAYIGGDIVAGALATRLDEGEDTVFFVDIGTNGEMIMRRDGKLVSCSCAAGPALEGMNISCGMRAAQGAVEKVRIRGDRVELGVIGGGAPRGVCGSGLLDAVSQGVAAGVIGKNGRIAPDHPLAGVDAQGKRRMALGGDLWLTQGDVRQVQLCKGAILSGCLTLMERLELRPEQIDRVLVAGQFGRHLSPESLVGAGLLPAGLKEKITYVGNTSRTGAMMCLLSTAERRRAEAIARSVSYVELATWPGYEAIFTGSLSF